MSTAMNALQAARDTLAAIPGVASCKVGLEAGIGPADYPLVRVVPSRITPGRPYGGRTVDAVVYFGVNRSVTEDGGLEAVYSALFDMETAIRSAVAGLGGRYIETITDEDRLDTYKLMAVRVELTA